VGEILRSERAASFITKQQTGSNSAGKSCREPASPKPKQRSASRFDRSPSRSSSGKERYKGTHNRN